jgi:hypothetical protein
MFAPPDLAGQRRLAGSVRLRLDMDFLTVSDSQAREPIAVAPVHAARLEPDGSVAAPAYFLEAVVDIGRPRVAVAAIIAMLVYTITALALSIFIMVHIHPRNTSDGACVYDWGLVAEGLSFFFFFFFFFFFGEFFF